MKAYKTCKFVNMKNETQDGSSGSICSLMLDCKGVNFLHISIANSCTQICQQKTRSPNISKLPSSRRSMYQSYAYTMQEDDGEIRYRSGATLW